RLETSAFVRNLWLGPVQIKFDKESGTYDRLHRRVLLQSCYSLANLAVNADDIWRVAISSLSPLNFPIPHLREGLRLFVYWDKTVVYPRQPPNNLNASNMSCMVTHIYGAYKRSGGILICASQGFHV